MENKNYTNELKKAIMTSFAEALDKVTDPLVKMLAANCARNEQSDLGDQSTIMTVTPKIRIEYSANGSKVKTTIEPKQVITVIGEAEVEFSIDFEQPDLPSGEERSESPEGKENND